MKVEIDAKAKNSKFITIVSKKAQYCTNCEKWVRPIIFELSKKVITLTAIFGILAICGGAFMINMNSYNTDSLSYVSPLGIIGPTSLAIGILLICTNITYIITKWFLCKRNICCPWCNIKLDGVDYGVYRDDREIKKNSKSKYFETFSE